RHTPAVAFERARFVPGQPHDFARAALLLAPRLSERAALPFQARLLVEGRLAAQLVTRRGRAHLVVPAGGERGSCRQKREGENRSRDHSYLKAFTGSARATSSA